jgi:hypothetical protein
MWGPLCRISHRSLLFPKKLIKNPWSKSKDFLIVDDRRDLGLGLALLQDVVHHYG